MTSKVIKGASIETCKTIHSEKRLKARAVRCRSECNVRWKWHRSVAKHTKSLELELHKLKTILKQTKAETAH